VASPLGANREIITTGVNGFLAATEDQWVEALRLLLSDGGLRGEMGREGRRSVSRRYAAEVQAPLVAEILKGVRG
jgi:glycosyltransferase involved in cell wall biosynthesis